MDTPVKADIYYYSNGCDLVMEVYKNISGQSERIATARHIVETLSKDELIRYIEEMLLGVEIIKQNERCGINN